MANSNLPALGLCQAFWERLWAVNVQACPKQQSREPVAQGFESWCCAMEVAEVHRDSPPALDFTPSPAVGQQAEAGQGLQRTRPVLLGVSAWGDGKNLCWARVGFLPSPLPSEIWKIRMYYRLRENYIPNVLCNCKICACYLPASLCQLQKEAYAGSAPCLLVVVFFFLSFWRTRY